MIKNYETADLQYVGSVVLYPHGDSGIMGGKRIVYMDSAHKKLADPAYVKELYDAGKLVFCMAGWAGGSNYPSVFSRPIARFDVSGVDVYTMPYISGTPDEYGDHTPIYKSVYAVASIE